MKKTDSYPFEWLFNKYLSFLLKAFLAPLRAVAGDPGSSDGFKLFVFAVRHLMSSILLFAAFSIFVETMSYFNISTDSFAGEIAGYMVGFPVILALIYFCLEFLRLLALAVGGGKASDELNGGMRFVIMTLGIMMFFGGMAAMISVQMKFRELSHIREEQKKLREEQQEYLSYLKQGKEVWNKYINRTPMHYITFADQQLDGFDFSGYDLSRVKFNRASLKNAVFNDSNLSFADLDHADCSGASFKGALMIGISLDKAILRNSDLAGAFLLKSDFSGALTEGASSDGLRSDFSASPWRKR